MLEFYVGNTVEIIGAEDESEYDDSYVGWDDAMYETIGCVGTIDTVNLGDEDEPRYRVVFDSGVRWWYQPEWLMPYVEKELEPIDIKELYGMEAVR